MHNVDLKFNAKLIHFGNPRTLKVCISHHRGCTNHEIAVWPTPCRNTPEFPSKSSQNRSKIYPKRIPKAMQKKHQMSNRILMDFAPQNGGQIHHKSIKNGIWEGFAAKMVPKRFPRRLKRLPETP